MTPVGTDGDVYPYVGLGIALAERGHRITLIANEHFKPLARQHRFDFAATGSLSAYQDALNNPHMLTNPVRGALPLRRLFCHEIPMQYRAIAEHLEPSKTIVLASGFASGARIAREMHTIPTAIIALQPMVLPTVAKLPHVPNWFPNLGKRFGWWIAALIGEIIMGRDVRKLRVELGLPPMRRVSSDWWLGPDMVIGLFPSWFAKLQLQWSVPVKLTGFVNYDGPSNSTERSLAGAEDFLREGEPPIVFTPGTGIRHGTQFFETAIDACAQLHRRGLLMTPCHELIPHALPDGIRHVPFAPFQALLPRAAAIVHHGGIGTTARALSAGIPQIVMPRIFDQHDNGMRLKQLGVGDIVLPRAFCGSVVAERLNKLLTSSQTRDACIRLADKCRKDVGATERTCALVERLVSAT